MNRYQRRKYGSSLPPRRPGTPSRRWTGYIVAIAVLVAVVYVRVFILR